MPGRLPDLPGPPPEFGDLVELARKEGYWVRWATNEQVSRDRGGRFWITRPDADFVIYANDDTENVRAWLHVQPA